uniref:Chromogranin-A n=1 Tax=Myotis lucifugus TaxID=59463 RepID=G1PFM5_MYOLU
MRSAAVLALLLCAGQVTALPVNSPMHKRDTEVMKCIVEVISDTLSKPSPMPVSQECFETLRGDERILSILRHQNLLKELQDLASPRAWEHFRQESWRQMVGWTRSCLCNSSHSSSTFWGHLRGLYFFKSPPSLRAEGTEETSSKDAEKRGHSNEVEEDGEDTDRSGPQASTELGQESKDEEDNQAPGEEEVANTHPPASLPSQKHPDPQAEGTSEGPSQDLVDREKGQGAEPGQQARREEEDDDDDEEAGEKVISEEEGPTEAFDPHPSLGYKEVRR